MSAPAQRRTLIVGVVGTVLASLLFAASVLSAPAASAQDESTRSLQAVMAESILQNGWWDESGSLSAADMDELVREFGDEFGFAFTDRSFEVTGDATQNPAGLLSQATLDLLAGSNGPSTFLLVTGDQVGGASNTFPFFNLGQVLAGFDRSDPPASFDAAATELIALGDNLAAIPDATSGLDAASTSDLAPESGIFAGMRIVIILAIVAAALAVASVISSRNKQTRRAVTTATARDSTKAELQAMSDLILDLDPRVTLADDSALKERFVDASTTYREVLEKAEGADTGHEIADLRIDISKARWKLDVIDAELSGRTPPMEPFSRDNSGSAWDSTRGRGEQG